MTNSISTLDAALKYLDSGFSVFPLLYCDKSPDFAQLPRVDGKATWKPFTTTHPMKCHVREWFMRGRQNIALVMGEISGNVIALDFDDHGAYDAWMERYPSIAKGTATQITKNGAHVLLRVPAPCPPNWAIKLDGVHIGEIRGEGGYIAAWPSIHPSGHQYEWVKAPWDNILAIDSLQDVGIARVVETPKTVATVPQNGKHPLPPRTQNFMINGAVVGRGVNDELFNAAIQHAAAGYSLDETEAALLPVARRFYIGTGPGNTEDQSRRTIKSGWSRGQGKEPITLKNPRDLGNTGGGRQANLLPKPRSRTLNQPDLGNTPSPGRGRSGAIEENVLPKSGENGDLGNTDAGAAPVVEPKSDLGNGNGSAGANSLPKPENEYKPHYTLTNGGIIYTSYKKSGDGFIPVDHLIPFTGQVTRKLTLFEEDGQQSVTYTIQGKKEGRPYSVDVDAVVFADGRQLYKKMLDYLPGGPPILEDHLIKRVAPAISAVSKGVKIEEIKAVGATGWTPDGKAFATPAGAIGKSDYVCQLSSGLNRELQGFGFRQNSEQENIDAVAMLLDLRKIYRPTSMNVILAHTFLPPLLRWIGTRGRYLLHIHAGTGSLKSELAKLMMAFYGPTGDHAITYKWTDTPNGVDSRANALKDCLMLIDDLKPNTIRPDHLSQWVSFVQRYVDAMAKKRATIGGDANSGRDPRCLLISTGEAIPEAGEASYIARMLLVQIDRQPKGVWNYNLSHIQDKIEKHENIFSGLMGDYIAWLLEGDGHDVASVFKAFQVESMDAEHLRLSNNYAANCTAARMFWQFCSDRGYMTDVDRWAFLAEHREGIMEVLNHTGEKIKSEQYSQRFIAALRDAVGTGFAYISMGKVRIDNGKRIGWEDDEFVYLLNGALSIANQWLRNSNQPAINMSVTELREQLYEDGLTESTPSRVQRGAYDIQRTDPVDGSKPMVTAVYKPKFYNTENQDE